MIIIWFSEDWTKICWGFISFVSIVWLQGFYFHNIYTYISIPFIYIYLYYTLQSEQCIWVVNDLTHWGRMTRICVSKLTIIGSDNGLAPSRRQAIIWTNAGTSLSGPQGTNFKKKIIEIHTFSFKKFHWKKLSGNGVHFVSVIGAQQSELLNALQPMKGAWL